MDVKAPDHIEFAGDYNCEHIFLHNHYGVVIDIKNMVQELNVYESIYKNALTGSIVIVDAQNLITKLEPENRYYPVTNNFTTEASIHANLFRDLYIVLGEGNLNDGWTVRIYYNPLVIWIWIGALIVFIGGLLLTITNIKKIKN